MARIIFISGACGCGKTTLADAYSRYLVSTDHKTVYVIHGDDFHQGFVEPEDKGDFFEDGQVEKSKVYMSGNATADEIVVVQCKDEDAAKKAGELLNTRVKNQKDLFSTYNADEAAKLDKAIVKTSGKYAVLCVCDDYDKAESILKDAGF